MAKTISNGLARNFLGHSPEWYKLTIIGFLILNPFLLKIAGPYVTGWALVLEFIFTLAMALKCYPLQAGGLLAIEALFIGLTNEHSVYHEIEHGLEVILLLVFMVAGIYFMKNLLLFCFTKLLLKVKSKLLLSLLFSFSAAVLSAFLDALTVTAVIISVAVGFYSIYHKVASGKQFHHAHDHNDDDEVHHLHREDLEEFRSFLRSLLMHAAVGTALGGVCTMVGEPQNVIIASQANWSFVEFFLRVAPVSMPVFVIGLITCAGLELTKVFGYGTPLPYKVRVILEEYDEEESKKRTKQDIAALVVQGTVAVWLVIGLMFHLAPVGLIGLSVIVLATAFMGITEEHAIGKAFEEALPFTALLVVFFAIVAVINDQKLFAPVIELVLQQEGNTRVAAFYLANGFLSMISDNVFVATVYIGEIKQALIGGIITRPEYDMMAVAINTGTNIPSVATPNGQAAFLFLLTSAIAPLVRLSYGRMVIMAFPYTITMSITGLFAVIYLLEPLTDMMYSAGVIMPH
ncbi:MAG: sodium/proton antiporter NhaB [Kordiimonas sp.]|nr:sodium/proton antiporter NhaB [Kordiimonas sp.]